MAEAQVRSGGKSGIISVKAASANGGKKRKAVVGENGVENDGEVEKKSKKTRRGKGGNGAKG